MHDTPVQDAALEAVPSPAAPADALEDAPTDTADEASENKRLRPVLSFVQRSSRLKDRQQRTWDEYAPLYVIEPPRVISKMSVQSDFLLDVEATFGRRAPLIVEIGSGQGEAIAHAAQENPDKNYLAVEVYRAGVAQTLQRIRKHKLTNIRIVQANAVEVLTTMLPAGCADELWVYFPDPWHKAKHNKRRMVTPEFTDKVARILKPGATWRLATDWADYARQMRDVLSPDARFDTDLHAPRFEGRVLTSFERKGLAKDREIADITAIYRPTA